MSDKSCDNCQLKECDLSDCMSRGCGGGPTYPGHLPVKVACPLPRIGSKDWGWKRTGSGVYESEKARYVVVAYADDYSEIASADNIALDAIIRVNGTIQDAKRIAELLARRDWRRENRGKNG